jgi:predicted RNA-binding protein with PUA domain
VLRNHVKPVFLLGFHEDVRLHRFELTQEGVRTLMDSINHHVWWARSFCDPLIDMF